MNRHSLTDSCRRRAVSLIAIVGMSANAGMAQAPVAVHRGFAASPTVAMRIYVPAGRVRIAVWSRDSIDIDGTMASTAFVFGGGSREAVKFGVEPRLTGDKELARVDWIVTVPRRARLWVKMTTGTIESDGTEGELELYTIDGSISVRGARGVTSVESIDAPVSISASSGSTRVRGGKGPLTLRDVSGTASVTSVSGRVEMIGTVAPEGSVETIGGDIHVNVARLNGVTLDLQTHSGAITAAIDRNSIPLLDLTSRTGLVTNAAPAGQAMYGRITARSFRGVITVRLVGQ